MSQTKRGRPKVYSDGLTKHQRFVQRRREKLRALKDAPCQDCGGRFPPECMDWDHREGGHKWDRPRKANGIMSNAHRRWSDLEAEIAKCDLICANCHRIRTRRRHEDVVT